MDLLVLYRIEEIKNGQWWCDDKYNAFEATLITHDSAHVVLFGDLQKYIHRNPVLKAAIGYQFSFFAELFGELLHLTSSSNILPIASNNTLRLRLRPTQLTPRDPSTFLMQAHMQSSYYYLSKVLLNRGAFSASSGKNLKSYPDENSSAVNYALHQEVNHSSKTEQIEESFPIDEEGDKSKVSSGVIGNGGVASGLNTFVGEEAAAVFTDAAEVAKEAAKSIFGFAATWGKSVLDAASTASTNALNGTSSRLSGNLTLGKMKVQVTRELSEGGFGIVYVAQDSNRSYALKQLICQSKPQLEEARTEIENLLLLRGHPNIIELIDHGSATPPNQPRQFYLLFPLYPVGTAWEAIERASLGIDPSSRIGPPWPFPEGRAIRVTLCAAKALEYMHRKGLSHRDVKPHNILLSDISDDRHVLMDFGSVASAQVNIQTRSDALLVEDEAAQKSSMAYRPPELTSVPFPPCTLDERIDVWALGCTMFCLAFGRSPFETSKEGVQKLAILNGRWSAPADLRMRDCSFRPSFVGLIEEMLHLDWSRRPYMKDVILRLQSLM